MDTIDQTQPVSKVLVLDTSRQHAATIKRFCAQNHLVPVKARPERLLKILRSNIDLGAILCAEDYAGDLAQTSALARQIHYERPELPILLRRGERQDLSDLDEDTRRAICACWSRDAISALGEPLAEYLFSMAYPNALVRGISEITRQVLTSQLPQFELMTHTPYIVRDPLIHGELFSLISLESRWCRGYMMLQAEEAPIMEALERSDATEPGCGFRDVNSVLSAATNLIWGGFKNRFVGESSTPPTNQIQVPLVVNHHHRYISFGTDNPQLCFLYTLRDCQSGRSMKLYQRFIFNLNWSPEDFRELAAAAEGLIGSGELELF